MRVAVVGGFGFALSFRLSSFPERGETVGRSLLETGPGGKGSNQAVGASRLGAEVALLTAVGDDAHGRSGFDLWRDAGVNSSAVVTVDAPTMVGAILIEEDGENRIVVAPGALDLLTPTHVEAFRDQIGQADVLLVSLEIPVDTAVTALRIARDQGVTTILNPAPFTPLPHETWTLVDVLTPNESELTAMTACTDLDESIRSIRSTYHGALVVTLGARGAEVVASESRTHLAAPRVASVVDSTGAGDSFNAALAVALASGASIASATASAVKAGAYSVSRRGVIPSLPFARDIE